MPRAIEVNNRTPTEGLLTYNHGFSEAVGSVIQFALDHSPRKPDLLKATALLASFASAATLLGGAPKAFASSEKGSAGVALKTGCILTPPKLNQDTDIVKTVADCRFNGRPIPASQLRWANLDVVTAQWPGSNTNYVRGNPTKPIRGKSSSLKLSEHGLNAVTFTVTTAKKYGANKAGKGGRILKKSVTAKFDQGGQDQVNYGMIDPHNLPSVPDVCDWGLPSNDPSNPNKCSIVSRDNPGDTTPVAIFDTKPTLVLTPDGGIDIVAPHILSPSGECNAVQLTDPLRKSPWGEIKQRNYWDCGPLPNGKKLFTDEFFIAYATNLAGDTCQLLDSQGSNSYGDVIKFALANPKLGGVLGVGFNLSNYNGDPTKTGKRISYQLATAYLYLPNKTGTGDICAGRPIILTAAEAAAARASSALPTTTTSR